MFSWKSWKEYLLLFIYLITLGKDVTFPLITKLKTNKYPSYLSVNRIPNYFIMRPRRLIHDINKPVLNLDFRFGLSFLSVNSIIFCAHHLLSD